MARKPARMTDEDSPLRRTEPTQPATPLTVPAEGYTRTVGVSLKESEIGLLTEIATDLGVSRNRLTRWIIRYGLTEMLAGRAKPVTRTTEQTMLDMP